MNMQQLRCRVRRARALGSLAALLLTAGCGMYGDLALEPPAPQAAPEVETLPPVAIDSNDAATPAAQDGTAEKKETPARPGSIPPDSGKDDTAGHP
jgi:hypothetical protein